MISIHRINDNYRKRIGKIGCEGCGRTVGFRTRRWWIELHFLHARNHAY